jgi:hypothetical protein
MKTFIIFWKGTAIVAINLDEDQPQPVEILKAYAKKYLMDYDKLTYTIVNTIPMPE